MDQFTGSVSKGFCITFFLTKEMCIYYGNKDQIEEFKENKNSLLHQHPMITANT